MLEIVFGIVIQGPGYLIVSALKGSRYGGVDPDGWLAGLVGIVFWVIVIGGIYGVYIAATKS